MSALADELRGLADHYVEFVAKHFPDRSPTSAEVLRRAAVALDAADRLAGYGCHYPSCSVFDKIPMGHTRGSQACSCGWTEALDAWREASR